MPLLSHTAAVLHPAAQRCHPNGPFQPLQPRADIQLCGQSNEFERRSQALLALDGLTQRSSADGGGALLAVQRSFREGGGFPLLVSLLDAAQPPKGEASPSKEQAAARDRGSREAGVQAVRALLATTRNSAESRWGTGDSPPGSFWFTTYLLHHLPIIYRLATIFWHQQTLTSIHMST